MEEIIIHPNFSSDAYNDINYDIALLKLSEKVVVGNIRVCLKKEEPLPDTLVTTTGWGSLSQFSSALSETLRYVHVPILNKVTCQRWYSGLNIIDFETMLCAGLKEGGKGPCYGDGGGDFKDYKMENTDNLSIYKLLLGPLLKKDTHELVGLASFGVGCAQPNYPAVYTNIPKFMGWIESKCLGCFARCGVSS